MATKKLIVETTVKTDQIDQAVQKLGQLKDLGRGLKIQYDIDNKPIDIVIDKSKNLQEQFKLVTRELKRTKEGTAEFALLAKTQGDIQDALARTKAKSGDLLTSLQLLPGPVGEFASKLNGAIALLKTFSSFSLKDLRFQLGETIGDLKDIVSGFLGIGDAAKVAGSAASSAASQAAGSAVGGAAGTAVGAGTGAGLGAAGGAAAASAAAIVANKFNIAEMTDAVELANKAVANLGKNFNAQVDILKNVNGAVTDVVVSYMLENGEMELLTANQIKNVAVSETQIVTTEALALAETEAAAATGLFAGALTALQAIFTGGIWLAFIAVIGAIVAGFYQLMPLLFNYTRETNANISATDAFTEALKREKEALNADIEAIDANTKALQTRAKIVGESEEQIAKIAIKAGKDKLEALREQDKLLFKEQDELRARKDLTNEQSAKLNKDINDRLLENNKLIIKQIIDNQQLGLDEELRIAEKKRQTLKNNNKAAVLDTKAANDLLLKLQQENSVNRLNEERKRQDAQLIFDKKNEESEIAKLFLIEGKKIKLTVEQEKLKSDLLEQVRVKFGLKVIDLNKKRQEEDNKSFDESQKKIKEYNDKVFAIMNAADESEIGRNKAALERKYADDVAALQKDTEFQKQSLEEKIRIILLLEKAKNQAIQKLDDEDAQDKRDKNLKRLDDELRLLDVKNKALIEGTKTYFKNQRDILEAANKKELADLQDRAIKEKLTAEQIKDEKDAINKAYLASLKDISKQELQVLAEQVQASLGVVQTALGDLSKVAQLGQQVALEQANKRFIEQNKLDQKQATSKEQLEKKLIENQKKFAQEEDDIKRRAFEENKKIQIAQAIIATLQSAVGAFSSLAPIPVVGPFLAAAAAASALVFGYKQVDLIKKTQYQSSLDLSNSQEIPERLNKANPGRNYADGGLIGGKRHAEGGTLIEAEKGEAIMTRGAVTAFGPLLSLMNQAGGGTSFNSNIMTTRQDNPILSNPAQEQSPLIVKTYVVSQELTTEAHRQARLKNLSTI
jgi:uncharacterized spore protein YtfJ